MASESKKRRQSERGQSGLGLSMAEAAMAGQQPPTTMGPMGGGMTAGPMEPLAGMAPGLGYGEARGRMRNQFDDALEFLRSKREKMPEQATGGPQGLMGMIPPMKPSDTFPAGPPQFNPYGNIPTQTQGMLSHLGQEQGMTPEQLQRLFAMISQMRGAGGGGGRGPVGTGPAGGGGFGSAGQGMGGGVGPGTGGMY